MKKKSTPPCVWGHMESTLVIRIARMILISPSQFILQKYNNGVMLPYLFRILKILPIIIFLLAA